MRAPIFIKAENLDFGDLPSLWAAFNIIDATTDYALARALTLKVVWQTPIMSAHVARSTPGIFVSYRRDDSEGHAGRMGDYLTNRYSKDGVFIDLAIPPGADFVITLEEAVESCAVLLAVIGRYWLTVTDENTGKRRLDNPKDFVRIEIATALQRNIPVIPVLVHRASMPSADDLPDDLKPLTRRQAHEMTQQHWHYDLDKLVAILDEVVGFKG